jgi:hypothetical protein
MYLTSIACVDADTCYALGRQSETQGPANVLTLLDGMITNNQTVPPGGPSFLQDLACSRSGACYAAGTATPGSGPPLLLTIAAGVPGTMLAVPGVGFLDGLACNAAGTCFAVGGTPGSNGQGTISQIVDGQVGPPFLVPGTRIVWDIDCPTVDTCYAIASADFGAATLMLPVADGQPGAVVPVQGGGLSAIACPSPDTCYAVGYAGGPASTNEGQGTGGFSVIVRGQPGTIQASDGAGPFVAIACPTASECLALGSVHGLPRSEAVTGPPGGAIVPIMNAVAAGVITTDSALVGGDCPTSLLCYAIGHQEVIPVTLGGG